MKHEEAMKKWHERTVKTTSERAERHSDFNPNDVGKKTSSWQKVGVVWRDATEHDKQLEQFYRTHDYVDGRWVLSDEEEEE
jgi:hypothetical protein